jgi:hypothetical protein
MRASGAIDEPRPLDIFRGHCSYSPLRPGISANTAKRLTISSYETGAKMPSKKLKVKVEQ